MYSYKVKGKNAAGRSITATMLRNGTESMNSEQHKSNLEEMLGSFQKMVTYEISGAVLESSTVKADEGYGEAGVDEWGSADVLHLNFTDMSDGSTRKYTLKEPATPPKEADIQTLAQAYKLLNGDLSPKEGYMESTSDTTIFTYQGS